MDSILSVQNKNFTRDGKEFTKVPPAVAKTESYFFGQLIHWTLENLVKIYHGILEPQHLIDPRQMALLKEPSAVLLQSGLEEKWCADAMECNCCDVSKTS